jgi:PhzF family phenazine biosynthesis protein
MTTAPFALYDSFSGAVLGGSQAGVLSDAAGLDRELRIRIAKEIGAPATCFVDWCDGCRVKAQFFSTVMEQPMCGHGTIALMTRLIEEGTLAWRNGDMLDVGLVLPKGEARVRVRRREEDGRPESMLGVRIARFSPATLDTNRLAELLGTSPAEYDHHLPIEVASADFVHLIVPMSGLKSMAKLAPDFGALAAFCRANGIETVATFSTEVEQSGYNLHVRDFCPAVGVAESAAAGTTNAALASYLIRHGLVAPDDHGHAVVKAEQGHEIGRHSTIRSEAEVEGGDVRRLQVGGIASKVMDGVVYLPVTDR